MPAFHHVTGCRGELLVNGHISIGVEPKSYQSFLELEDVFALERRALARDFPEYRPGGIRRLAGRAVFRVYQACSPGWWGACVSSLRERRRRLDGGGP